MNKIGVLLAALLLTGCSSLQHTLPVTSAAGLGAGVGAAISTSNPIAGAVIGAATATAVTEVVVPPESKQPLSSDPTIAAKQLEAEEKKFWIMAFERLGIYALILFALVFWILPDPMHILNKFRRPKDG